MVIVINCELVKKIIDTILDKDEKDIVAKANYYLHRGGQDQKLRFNISEFGDESIQKIHGLLSSFPDDKSIVRARNLVAGWQAIKKNPDGSKCGNLESLPGVMMQYLRKSAPHRWLFTKDDEGQLLPVFVSGIFFNEARNYTPAHVTISMSYYNFATGRYPTERNRQSPGTSSIDIFRKDITGKTISEILAVRGYFIENAALVAEYRKTVELWMELEGEVGLQMSVTGKVTELSGWYEGSGRKRFAQRSGCPVRMVIDPKERETGAASVESTFWAGKEDIFEDGEFPAEAEDDDGEEDEVKRRKPRRSKKEEEEPVRVWEVPVHPFLELFDLEEHIRVAAHVSSCSPYVYDEKVGDKLVLPDEVKDLIEALIHEAGETFEDIVEGKSGGIIVLITGTPGTGKTLTAEVYSEVMKRPLYKVNSSQLGVNIADIEKELKIVLQRSEKWGAILLIDEADVYVRARGDDIQQNAIVGVFLRVLEYYRGVLFMTSNRGTIIDDAIISRLTARMEYQKPNDEERGRIWNIIADQNGIKLEPFEVSSLVRDLPGISGRDIKMLLKLARMYSRRKGIPVDAALIKRLNKYKGSGKENAA